MSSSTYTPNLGIEEPATGSYPNTWGDVANRSYRVIDAAIGGVATITLTGATYHLTTTNGTDASNALYPMLTWSGAPGAAATVTIAPNTQQRLYIMANRTTDANAITFTQGGGTPFTLQSGYDAHIYCDGNANNAGVAAALQNPQFNNMLVTGTLNIQGNLTGNLNLGNISAASLGLGSPTSVPDPLTINGVGPGGQIRLVEVNGVNCGTILRNDGNSFYIMATAPGQPYAGWNTAIPIPLTVNLSSGAVTAGAGLTAPTIQSTGPLYAGTVVNTLNLNAVGSIAIDTGLTNSGGIDLFFGANTEGIGSARSGGAPQNQGGLTLFTAGAARLVVTNSGPVGVNMMPDGHWLCVNGYIHSASGGFVFPDGSVQTTAISGTLTQLTVTGNATIGGTLTLGGNMSVTNGNINLAAGHTYQVNGVPLSSGITGIEFYYGGVNQGWSEPGIMIQSGYGIQVTISHAPGQFGEYTISNTLSCDERVKRNIHPLQGGLSVINQLRPIEAEFNGLGATREGERTVGVLAQELERVLPGSVVKMRGKLRPSDAEETDLLYIGTYELLFQMLLAIQQLYRRSETQYGRHT